MTITRVIKKLWYIIAVILIMAALVISSARLFTPYLNRYLPDFEILGSDLLKTPITINHVSLVWDTYQPELSFDQVNLIDPKTKKPVFKIDHIKLNFGIIKSLLHLRMIIDKITIAGVHLKIRQNSLDQWSIQGLTNLQVSDKFTETSVQAKEALAWIFSMSSLVLKNIDIDFQADQQKTSYLFFLNQLTLKNNEKEHHLLGIGVLNQNIPTKIIFDLVWQGNMADLTQISAHAYCYLEGINLRQWFGNFKWHNFQITQGLGSAKIWFDWNHNAFQKIQTHVQLYGLEVKSLLSNKSEIFPRLSGHFGWKNDGEKRIFAGDQIYIDFQERLWPETRFSITMNEDQHKKMIIDSLEISYINLLDISKLIQWSGLASDNILKKIHQFNPTGELLDMQIRFLTNVLDLEHISINFMFNKLYVSPWKNFPGISNINGLLAWDGKQGNLLLNSAHTAINFNNIFSNALYLDHVTGKIFFQKNNQEWLIESKDFIAQNADLKFHADVNVILPQQNSPEINLISEFQVLNVKNIANYLPLKILDTELSQWLQHAFLSGKLDSGKAIIKGRLADFPFENGKGEFQVSGEVNNIDLHFAPRWPDLSKIKGELVFQDRAMQLHVNSAYIANVPLHDFNAEIPYIGEDKPIILTVQGNIHADLADGLRFIKESPLTKMIGDMNNLELEGVMQLKLGLSVPLKSPEQTKVKGNITFPSAKLKIPEWKLALESLQGNVYFTENTIDAKNLIGKFMGENALLSLSTVQSSQQKSNYLQANLQTKIAIPTLQSMLGISLNEFAQGKTQLDAELHIFSADANPSTEVILQSNLKGISINLPDPYGKKMEELRNIKITLLTQKEKLRIKANYNQILNAVLQFEQFKKGWEFLSGDVNFGKLSMYDQTLKDAKIKVIKAANVWSVHVDSDNAVGQITINDKLNNLIVNGKFQHLFLTSSKNNKPFNVDIKKMPALSLVIDDMRYQDKQFGTVILDLIPSGNSIQIHELRIESSLVNLRAQGEWQIIDKKNMTHLNGMMNTTRLSDLLNEVGFSINNFVAKNAEIGFDLRWPDVPYSPTTKGLSGNLSLSIGPGRIVDIGESNNAKMGLGRLISIFSLSSIPQHLSFRFKDISDTGYIFEYIKGNFKLNNGNAFTDSIQIEGPLAHVSIAGRIGLYNKDFDIKLDVTPYVTTGISTVAAVASLNPLIGIATWALDKAISHTVSKAVVHHYSVSGPWDKPVWNQADKPD